MGGCKSALCVGLCLFCFYVQARTVRGRVVSAEDGEPLIGATVRVPNSSTGVMTDMDGNYLLNISDKDKV